MEALEVPVFHNFGRLPKELRLRIWEMTLPRPPIVPITFERIPRVQNDD
jgi:hypothetical protein